MAVCISLIGKENAPKYITCLDYEKETEFHYKIHTSLDIIEEKLNNSVKTANDTRELYLGLLYATEEYKIFGYVTNTKIKIVIIIDANHSSLRDNEIRAKVSNYDPTDIITKLIAFLSCGFIYCLIILISPGYGKQNFEKMFRNLHAAYADVVCNPFHIPGESITSKKFHNIVEGMMYSKKI